MNIRFQLALALTVTSLGLAAPVWASKCDLLPEAARAQYRGLDEAMKKAEEAAQKSAIAIKDFLQEFEKPINEYDQSLQALKAHAGKKPATDISVPILPDRRSLENQAQLKEWEAAKLRLESQREQKMAGVNAAFAKLGNWHNWFMSGGGTVQLQQTKNAIEEVLSVLDADGTRVAQSYGRMIDFIAKPPSGTDDYSMSHYKSVPSDSGLLEAADQSTAAAKKAKKELLAFSNKCPYGVVIDDRPATDGRDSDAGDVDRNRNTNGNGNANRANSNNANGNGNRNANANDDEDLAVFTNERNGNGRRNSNNANRANANNANNANRADANNANSSGNANSASPGKYTVKEGDNLTAIARKLAPSLGNPPLSELISALYSNMTTKSRKNPSLIFPGDSIDLAAVKKDLAA